MCSISYPPYRKLCITDCIFRIRIIRGNTTWLFVEATEHERLLELRTFISRLHIKTTLLGNTVSNTVPFVGMIPNDRVRILNELDSAIKNAGEKELRRYRDSIRSL